MGYLILIDPTPGILLVVMKMPLANAFLRHREGNSTKLLKQVGYRECQFWKCVLGVAVLRSKFLVGS